MTHSLDLAAIMMRYRDRFKAQYAGQTSAEQWSAIHAITGCRTAQYGDMTLACDACAEHTHQHRSCGHRACNQCQYNATSDWLERQERKLLPVDYFMATFTLPKELRTLAKAHQKVVYTQLFRCAVETLKTFALNHKDFQCELAMTAVLHTHTRRLDYHPHMHIVVPAGGVHRARREWRTLRGKYLFNGRALAAKFRGAMLRALSEAGLCVPKTPTKWVTQCQRVGRGLPALQYLSRYLYRGVIRPKNILSDDGTLVTFRYTESQTGDIKTRTLKGEDFMALVLQHTLPKGFRRVRDYGFLHGNAKRALACIQVCLKVHMPIPKPRKKAIFTCPNCKGHMRIVHIHIPTRKIETNLHMKLVPD